MDTINQSSMDGLQSDNSQYKVLCIDDSKFVLKQLSQILTSACYEVCGTALDGEEGVELFKAISPDLVTLDITMAKMDGIAALEQIMKIDPNAKVIMISALGKEELVKKSLLLGAKNFIVKPLNRKIVLQRVKLVLSKK